MRHTSSRPLIDNGVRSDQRGRRRAYGPGACHTICCVLQVAYGALNDAMVTDLTISKYLRFCKSTMPEDG